MEIETHSPPNLPLEEGGDYWRNFKYIWFVSCNGKLINVSGRKKTGGWTPGKSRQNCIKI
jgi:hypothetical protein